MGNMVHENDGAFFSADDILPYIKTPEELLAAITETYKEIYRSMQSSTPERDQAEKELLKNFAQKAGDMGISSYEVAVAVMKGMPRTAKQEFFEEIERGVIFSEQNSAYFGTEITPEEVLKLKNKFVLFSTMNLKES